MGFQASERNDIIAAVKKRFDYPDTGRIEIRVEYPAIISLFIIQLDYTGIIFTFEGTVAKISKVFSGFLFCTVDSARIT